MLVDSHCHLDRLDYANKHIDVADVLAKAAERGVSHCLAVGILPSQFASMYDKVASFSQVHLSCGMHPLYMDKEELDIDLLRQQAQLDKVVAIGETGLDYFYAPEHKALQQQAFCAQIDLAVEVNKPLIVHTRDARDDTMSLLSKHNAERCKGVLHCFTESYDMAMQAIEMGFYISASGIISFNSAKSLQETFKRLPLERILVETDSPYLAPVPYRGEENQPAYVRQVAQCLADIKGCSLDAVAKQTTQNYFDLFKLG